MNHSRSKSRIPIFAVCPPGIEDILFRELLALGITGKKVTGGVEFQGNLATVYSVNLWSRTASRVLVRVGNFKLASLREARDRFARYPWELYLYGEKQIRIRASTHRSRIYHSGALAQRLAEGISQRLGTPVTPVSEREGSRSPLVLVRIFRDRCQISIDSSGVHLHKRGFKKFTVRAPLRENLAAALLLASGWDGSSCLLDPFCGSGTILMEAILLARKIPPGRRRSFSFMKWKNFDQDLWHEILRRSDRLATDHAGKILGMDRDAAAVEAVLMNMEHAGLSSTANITHGDVSRLPELDLPQTGLIATNPPYGLRLRENYGLAHTYATLGRTLRQHIPGWHITILCPRDRSRLARALDLSLKPICKFLNGGIRVNLLSGPVS